MINFTVGPVQTEESIRAVLAENIPYFRTAEFSSVMKENEKLLLKYLSAPDNSRAVFLTGSGTCAMETCVMNLLGSRDKALVVNGGSFGKRFAELLALHRIEYSEIKLGFGKKLAASHLEPFKNKGYTAFLVNLHETSTGVLYDLPLISRFCRENGLFLIIDAISSFIADELDMGESGAGAVIIGSQKALALAPGLSAVALSPEGVERAENSSAEIMYMNLKTALKDGERGQTPFTPAVGVLLQLNKRLNSIETAGGIKTERAKIAFLASDFRRKIAGLPFTVPSENLSSAVTPLKPDNASAYDIFEILKNEYGIWVCPNGGELRDLLFRVGHLGDLTVKDNDILIEALYDLKRRKLI